MSSVPMAAAVRRTLQQPLVVYSMRDLASSSRYPLYEALVFSLPFVCARARLTASIKMYCVACLRARVSFNVLQMLRMSVCGVDERTRGTAAPQQPTERAAHTHTRSLRHKLIPKVMTHNEKHTHRTCDGWTNSRRLNILHIRLIFAFVFYTMTIIIINTCFILHTSTMSFRMPMFVQQNMTRKIPSASLCIIVFVCSGNSAENKVEYLRTTTRNSCESDISIYLISGERRRHRNQNHLPLSPSAQTVFSLGIHFPSQYSQTHIFDTRTIWLCAMMAAKSRQVDKL